MTKDEAILAAARDMENSRYEALALGATSDDILAALSTL
ncbi:hypothetical protein P3T35_003058 [Kitasatospora sp. GP30]|jgi:hypothetical protein|nr:hypothetical protein [Kitasatospora sp. GP30]